MSKSKYIIWDTETGQELEFDDFQHAVSEYKHKIMHNQTGWQFINNRYRLILHVI